GRGVAADRPDRAQGGAHHRLARHAGAALRGHAADGGGGQAQTREARAQDHRARGGGAGARLDGPLRDRRRQRHRPVRVLKRAAVLLDANPGVDPWVPAVGTDVVVPTEWVLPCCTYQGIVVNIPELRLYYFRPAPDDPRTTLLTTYPVGLGREDWRTPRGKFRVQAKHVKPTWYIPESIRREHIAERGDARRFIPGGAPDNPLGGYRLQLSRSTYGIHGTDIPWGIGREATHGCVRLYPEDIERLFPLVPVGTPVEFTYQPVKVGDRGGAVYVEAHRDVYRYTRSLAAA